jgi:hypothetical protein
MDSAKMFLKSKFFEDQPLGMPSKLTTIDPNFNAREAAEEFKSWHQPAALGCKVVIDQVGWAGGSSIRRSIDSEELTKEAGFDSSDNSYLDEKSLDVTINFVYIFIKA